MRPSCRSFLVEEVANFEDVAGSDWIAIFGGPAVHAPLPRAICLARSRELTRMFPRCGKPFAEQLGVEDESHQSAMFMAARSIWGPGGTGTPETKLAGDE